VSEDHVVQDWAGVTDDELRAAFKAVGDRAPGVEAELRMG
jgi:hypothetical protein